MKVQVLLVSDQVLANLMPVLMERPRRVFLVVMLFIDCKTLRYRDQNDNQIAYKPDSLGEDARGLFGRTWLLSAREPTDTLIARARRARIRLVPPAELQRLRELVREWRG